LGTFDGLGSGKYAMAELPSTRIDKGQRQKLPKTLEQGAIWLRVCRKAVPLSR
jgi:hypothetical protein